MTIGKRIKERRNELKLSQRELAARMGYSHHSTLARIETGKVDVSQSRIEKFAEVLDTSIAFLMGLEEEEKKGQPEASELSVRKKAFMQKVEGMSDAQIERLEQILALVENTEL